VRTLPEYEIIHREGGQPIVLMGSPERLTGEISLSNPGDRRVVVRAASIRQIPAEASRAAPAVQEVAARMVAILRPGHQTRTRVHVQLPPVTAPGRYEVELALGKYSYPAILHVTENIDLDISPDTVYIENRPGTRVIKQVTIRNLGNVPLTIGSPRHVALDDELIQCRALRGTLSAGYDKANTWEEWLTILLREGKKGLDQAGMLWVQNQEGEVILKPGETRNITFQIRQPDTNDPTTRYLGVAFFYTANLNFSVVPSGYLPGHEQEPRESESEPRTETNSTKKPKRSGSSK
jgi:hypothetical protein